MGIFISSYLWIFCVLAQTAVQVPVAGTDCLPSAERSRLERETKLDNRIKIYDEADERCKSNLMALLQQQEFQSLPGQLNAWSAMLESSLADIETSPGRKDKSKALIRFEIHLRRAIGAVQESKVKASVEQQDSFESWLNRAERVHKRLVAILFPK